MKRLIILLLLLSSFRFSYAEELTAEQQQLAWKFIYDNMLHKNRPYTFHGDININLIGTITAGDSVAINDIIKSIQKSIPILKIQLSAKPGNFIFGLNSEKRTLYEFSVYDDNGINSLELNFNWSGEMPNELRKKIIYWQLFRGMVYYFEPSASVVGMSDCVFNAKNPQLISYSPFDLYILEKLYSPQFPILLAQNLSPELQKTAWNVIRYMFMGGGTKVPVIYKDDIAIQLDGFVTRTDSLMINELITQLRYIIPNRKIKLTTELPNLVIHIGHTISSTYSTSRSTVNAIKFREIGIDDSLVNDEDRKKVLYSVLYQSLVSFRVTEFSGWVNASGSVFDFKENDPKKITFNPLDAFILNKLYSDDFQDQFKKQYISQFSYREYLVLMYQNKINLLSFLLALIIPAILLTRLILKGTFKPHRWSWKEYNKQGLFLMAICCIYLLFISLADLRFNFRILGFSIFVLQCLIAINLSFYIERFILRNRNIGGSKVIVIFLITFIVMSISLMWFSWSIIELDRINQNAYFPFLTISNIILFTLARSLYVFLNDRYKSIIIQKDVELAQMGEFQKQAELQSLRAKINPHFLYNALNSIASLATTDARKTEQMALALSDFFKYAINREQKQLNTLSEELNAIRTYLEIEKVRFGERLSFEIDCPEELLNIQIPQLLIQPLVENAIKHGLSQITENGLIRILVSRADTQLKIRVYDNGPAFPDGPLSGFGIQNTQERIALLYAAKAKIDWQNGAEKYIELRLPIGNEPG